MNLKEIILGVTIVVLTLFVTVYGVDMFYSKPLYEDFCQETLLKVSSTNEINCLEKGGEWHMYDDPRGEQNGYCEKDFICSKDYDSAQETYSRNIFLITVPLGILIILFGAYFLSLDAVGIGLMAGGIGTMLRGFFSFWRYSEDWLRFSFSLVGLLIVIYFSYRFSERLDFKKSKKKKK